MQAAAKQMLHPKYSMGYEWNSKRGADDMPLVRTLRTLLTNNIPNILPGIHIGVEKLLDRIYHALPNRNQNARHAPIFETVIQTVAYSNAVALFGPDLAENKMFMKSAIKFVHDTVIIAEVIRLVPVWMAPLIGKILAATFSSHKILYSTLLQTTLARAEERSRKQGEDTAPKHKDCLLWLMETGPTWTLERTTHELMALWFGTVHIVTTTTYFAIHDLCLHPE